MMTFLNDEKGILGPCQITAVFPCNCFSGATKETPCFFSSLWEVWQEAVNYTHSPLALGFCILVEMLCGSLLSCWLLQFLHFRSWVCYCLPFPPPFLKSHLIFSQPIKGGSTGPHGGWRCTWRHLFIFFKKIRPFWNKWGTTGSCWDSGAKWRPGNLDPSFPIQLEFSHRELRMLIVPHSEIWPPVGPFFQHQACH